jgi:endonuclease/exonuclease/phosphatase family metal-dependent hydrolase
MDDKVFYITNIYGPTNPAQKQSFVNWLMNLNTINFDDWLLGGDFNLIRSPDNRNEPGGDTSEMFMFNELISDLDLVEILFSGRSFTWSNMQEYPLLVKLDWVFTSANWTMNFPSTYVQPLSKPISDHIPYVVHIMSSIPKSKLFRFENYWADHLGFYDTVSLR